MAALARTEFSSALNAIANESGLDVSIVLDTIKQAILAAYRRDARERGEEIPEEDEFKIEIDPESGGARVFSLPGDVDVTPPGFGRIAVQTAKQVILQKLREAERSAILAQYETRIGSLVSGTILRFDGSAVRVDLGKTEGVLPQQERIPTEKFTLNQRLQFLLKELKETERGKEIILSRADPAIVKKLFAREVPEIASGAVEIRAIAREPGNRTKVAVASTQSGVDPVGSCVGQKGVRVQAVIGELNNEKIDVIPWTTDTRELIAFALSPADGVIVSLDEEKKQAIAKVPEDQLSLAIGRDGQNVRLAGKLSGWRIEVEGIKQKEDKEDKKKETEKAEKKEDVKDVKKEQKPKKKTKKAKVKSKKVKTKSKKKDEK